MADEHHRICKTNKSEIESNALKCTSTIQACENSSFSVQAQSNKELVEFSIDDVVTSENEPQDFSSLQHTLYENSNEMLREESIPVTVGPNQLSQSQNKFCNKFFPKNLDDVVNIFTGSFSGPVMMAANTIPKLVTKRKSSSQTSEVIKREKFDDMDCFRTYISNLIEKGLLKPGGTYKHILPTKNGACKPDLKEFLMLDVIFWDLGTVCSNKNIQLKLSCPECDAKLSPIPLGPRKRFMMRKLYGLHEPVLLITSLFRCSSARKHDLLGYDPRLLRTLPQLDINFLLFHRAGTTRELVDHILHNTTIGVKIHQIQDRLSGNYLVSMTKRKEAYEDCCSEYLTNNTPDKPNSVQVFPFCKSNSPSVSLVTQCCLTAFKEKEEFYRLSMSQVKAEKFFYFDDSFQVTSNLQAPKNSAKKTIQYKRVMYITNEVGQVMTWQLIKDNTYKEIASVMAMIKKRHQKFDIALNGCLTNRCCEWSNELKQTFGVDFLVKGNLSLFLERVSRSMPVDCEARSDCLRHLELVFRQDGDGEIERRQNTPDVKTIQNKLDDFLAKWKYLKGPTGTHVITFNAMEEIHALSQHIENGCLSDVPVLPMINSADNFLETHQTLQKWVANARIGIPLGMALFSIGFHALNSERGVVGVVGVVESVNENKLTERSSKSSDVPKLNAVIEIVANALISNLFSAKEEKLNALSQILMYLKCYQSITHFVPDVLNVPRLIPYFLSPLHLIISPCFQKNDESLRLDYLNGVDELRSCLSKSAFQDNRVDDSILSAVVSYLKTYFDLHGESTPTKDYYDALRQQGINFTEQYESIVDIVAKRVSFSYDVVSFWDALIALANTFEAVIFLITNFRRFPVLPVYPKLWNRNAPSVFLLYREDIFVPVLLDLTSVNSAVTSSLSTQQDSASKNYRCRCGRGKAEGAQLPKCVTNEGQRYPSRCLCFRAGEACSSICDCRACGNPHGSRITKTQFIDPVTGKRTRKRHAHDGQNLFREILSRVPSRFTSNNNSWNSIECLLFELSLSVFVLDSNVDLIGVASKLIHEKYCGLVRTLLEICDLVKMLTLKSITDIEQKLSEREEDILGCLEIFENNTI